MNNTTQQDRHSDVEALKSEVDQKIESFKAEIDQWFDTKSLKMDDSNGLDWQENFRHKRDEIEAMMSRYASDVSEARSDAADSWSEFRVNAKDKLDMLQNRAEELWNRATA